MRRSTRKAAGLPGETGYRLCLVSDSSGVGGAERFLSYLSSALPGGVDVQLLATSSLVAAAVASQRVHAAVVTPLGVRAARRALRRLRPDVVHANLIAFPSCRSAIVAALSLRLPVVLVDHLPIPGLTWRGRLLQRLVTRACAARVALGLGARRQVSEDGGIPSSSVLSIPNGVPATARPAGPRPRPSAPVLGVLCRLERQKGLDLLLHALEHLPEAQLAIRGDGSERERLHELVKELGLAHRVRFRGWVADAPAFLDKIDVLVVPSREEAMPLVVLEAMHAGLPVVATAVGSLEEVVLDRGTGRIVPPEDVPALTEACRELIADRELRR